MQALEGKFVASVTVSGLTLDVVGSLGEVEALWRAFEQEAACTAFQAFDWHDAWQRNIGARQGVRVAVVVARREGRVVALFPLQVEKTHSINLLRWHASDLCDYNTPLLAPDFESLPAAGNFAEVYGAMLGLVRATPGLTFDGVELTKMPERVGTQPNPFLKILTTLNPNGAYATPIHGPWEDFYKEKRSSSTRRRDRTKRKRMADIGEVAFVTAEGADAVRDALFTLMEQKEQAFVHMGVPNLFARPGYRDFYMDISTRENARLAHVSRLTVGGETAACNMGLMFRGAYYHVLASYSGGEVSRHGPGAAHLHEIMRYAIDSGCSVFDFTIGEERYKQEWSDGVLLLHDHRCAVSLKGHIVLLPTIISEQAKRAIKQNPTLWKLAQKVRTWKGTLRGGKGAPAGEPQDRQQAD